MLVIDCGVMWLCGVALAHAAYAVVDQQTERCQRDVSACGPRLLRADADDLLDAMVQHVTATYSGTRTEALLLRMAHKCSDDSSRSAYAVCTVRAAHAVAYPDVHRALFVCT